MQQIQIMTLEYLEEIKIRLTRFQQSEQSEQVTKEELDNLHRLPLIKLSHLKQKKRRKLILFQQYQTSQVEDEWSSNLIQINQMCSLLEDMFQVEWRIILKKVKDEEDLSEVIKLLLSLHKRFKLEIHLLSMIILMQIKLNQAAEESTLTF